MIYIYIIGGDWNCAENISLYKNGGFVTARNVGAENINFDAIEKLHPSEKVGPRYFE